MNKQNQQLIYLKIKVKSLAEEARIIRSEERKLKKVPWEKRRIKHVGYCSTKIWHTEPLNGLQQHRVWNVRNECRATQLAIAFIKGKPYKSIEPKCKDTHKRDTWILPRVVKMIQKYGNSKITKDHVNCWVDGYENT